MPAPAAAQVVVTVTGNPIELEPAASHGYAVERSYYKLDGTQVDPAQVRQNERLVTVLKVTESGGAGRAPAPRRPPAGRASRSTTRSSSTATPSRRSPGSRREVEPATPEYRDDRFVAAFDRDAEPAGVLHAWPTWSAPSRRAATCTRRPLVEDMYRPERFGRTAFGTVEVTAARP